MKVYSPNATWPAVKAAERAHPGLRIEEFGDASADKAISAAFDKDFKKAEFLSLPITLIILILSAGSKGAAREAPGELDAWWCPCCLAS